MTELTRYACKHAGAQAPFCTVKHAEERMQGVALDVTAEENKVVATLKRRKECRTVTVLGEASSWEACGDKPEADAELRLSAPIFVHDDPALRSKTDADGRATFDLTNVRVASRSRVDDKVEGEVRYFAPSGGQAWKRFEVSKLPLFATWKADAEKRRADEAAEDRAKREAELVKVKEDCAAGDKRRCTEADFLRNKIDCRAGSAQACFAGAQDMERRLRECTGAAPGRDTWCPMGSKSLRLSGQSEFLKAACDLKHAEACALRPKVEAALAEVDAENDARSAQATAQRAAAESTPDFGGDAGPFQDRCKRGAAAACVVMKSIAECQQGLSNGCDSAGNAYLGAMGVTKDLERTRKYWMHGCRIDASKCAAYGIRFHNTRDFPANEKRADEFFDQGCAGDPRQCAMIGTIYQRGAGGVRPDNAKGRAYLERGCQAGDATSCMTLRRR